MIVRPERPSSTSAPNRNCKKEIGDLGRQPQRGAGAGCRVGLLAELAGSARPSRAGNGGESG